MYPKLVVLFCCPIIINIGNNNLSLESVASLFIISIIIKGMDGTAPGSPWFCIIKKIGSILLIELSELDMDIIKMAIMGSICCGGRW